MTDKLRKYLVAFETPKGSIPKRLFLIVWISAAGLVLLTSFCSQRKKPEAIPEQLTARVSASNSKGISELLSRVQPSLPSPSPVAAAPPAVTAATKRSQTKLQHQVEIPGGSIPGASRSLVFVAPENNSEQRRASRIVVSASDATDLFGSQNEAGEYRQSGKLLPPQENGLFRIYEGTLVKTALLNRLEGTFTGPVRTVVTSPVTGMDATVVIPSGAIFMGEAKRVEEQNQTRLALSFKRLLMPNGYSVALAAAPGLDRGGATGLKDKVDNHRLSTFVVSGAMGLLGGLALYRDPSNPYAGGIANTSGQAATTTLSTLLNRLPTITIREGFSVSVYIPTDLLLPPYSE